MEAEHKHLLSGNKHYYLGKYEKMKKEYETKVKLTELEALKSEHDVVKAVIENNITRKF